jgi:predicted small lipoprotein YifL
VRISVHRLGRLAMAAALTAAALGLASCGRKGPLDPPPAAGLTEPPSPRPSLGEQSEAIPPSPSFDVRPPRATAAAAPATPPPPPKSFFLDFLVGK